MYPCLYTGLGSDVLAGLRALYTPQVPGPGILAHGLQLSDRVIISVEVESSAPRTDQPLVIDRCGPYGTEAIAVGSFGPGERLCAIDHRAPSRDEWYEVRVDRSGFAAVPVRVVPFAPSSHNTLGRPSVSTGLSGR